MNSGTKFKAIAAIMFGLALAGCGGGGGDDDDTPSNNPSSTPQSGAVSSGGAEYLTQTYQTGQSQAQQSEAATQKSTNPAVRELAQQVNNEITIINQQITNISQSSNVTVNNTLTNEQKVEINNLNSLSGAEFDRAYLRNLVTSVKRLLALTLQQAREGGDVQIRQNAAANVLLIQQRLAAAQETLCLLEPPQYLIGAFEDSLLEIELARIALQKATNDAVKQFAQTMIDEHTQLNTQITALAAQKGVTLPTELGPDKQEIATTISAFSGADFDKAYMDRNVLQHAEDIAKTTVVAEQSTDVEIKAFAAQTLPLLQEHFEQALTISASLQPSAVYQLGQSLVAELQLAQIAQTRSTDDQGRNFGQTIIQQNQASFTQLVQVAQQQNAQIPLVIPPGQVQAALQLLQTSGLNLQQIQSLINTQLSQSLQIAQSLQTSTEAGVGNVARVRVQALQNLDINAEQGADNGTDPTGVEGNDAAGGGAAGGTDDNGTSVSIDGGNESVVITQNE
ncbi:DUF4142 domain-containing protein [Oxalobacteraceae bacterium R-40]|uniref:DUF4142 domain-containing protein n=1 Tax=Keguizhuia sedimenti TaxID=3064264 RepID=A0ABU1BTR8_9BURK|nr:DUF4142 domain-containing protein [Oxalobacteraceae bacterium R-40]